VVAASSLALSPLAIGRSSSTSSMSARRRVSSLGTTGSSDDLAGAQPQQLAVRMRHQSSPLASPTFQHGKSLDQSGSAFGTPNSTGSGNAYPGPAHRAQVYAGRGLGNSEYPEIDLGGTTLYPHGIIASRRSSATQRRRLIAFGVIVLALSLLMWFSIYQRHSIWGSMDSEKIPETEQRPWLILAMVLTFLGVAAVYAGITLKRDEEETRVRVVQGDAVLGMIAEQGARDQTPEYTEPTTPQRAWAIKALSEVNDRI